MPPRTTRKSDRRKASDRTMVGTAQPLCLSASGTERRRYDSTMNLRKRKHHRVSFHYWGWTARPLLLCLAVAGEAFVLTSPFIERDYRRLGYWYPTFREADLSGLGFSPLRGCLTLQRTVIAVTLDYLDAGNMARFAFARTPINAFGIAPVMFLSGGQSKKNLGPGRVVLCPNGPGLIVCSTARRRLPPSQNIVDLHRASRTHNS